MKNKTSPPNPLSKVERGNTPSHAGKGPGVRSSGIRSIFGQNIDTVKLARARELRHDMTEAERILWRDLRTNHFHGLHFRRQQIIEGFIADFYCHEAGLVIEVDGAIHEDQADYDTERDAVLTACGLRVIRVTNNEVLKNIEGVLARIAAYLAPNPFPCREGAIDFPSQGGKGPGVRSSGVRL